MKSFALLAVAALAFGVRLGMPCPTTCRRPPHRLRQGPPQLTRHVAAKGAAAKAGLAGAVKMVSACHTLI
jgi:hypothetical protein